MSRTPYSSLYERMLANTAEPSNEQDCWRWTARLDRWGYGILDLYVPGLERNATLKAHIALYCWVEARCRCATDLFLAYREQVASGLQLDHLCRESWCINLDHIEPVTAQVNVARRTAAKRLAPACSVCYSQLSPQQGVQT